MTTINTTEDLLLVVRENEAFRAAMRREILTAELLGLPGQFTAMQKTQNRMLAELAETRETQASMLETQNRMLAELAETRETQASMLETQNRMLAELAETRETQASMLETQNRMLAELAETRETQASMLETQNAMLEEQAGFRSVQAAMLEELSKMRGDIHSLHRMYRQQHEDMGRFRGNYAISAMRSSDYDIARPFARMRGIRRTSLRKLARPELSRILRENYDAVDDLGLRDRSWESFQNPDLIAEITGIRNSVTSFYISVEASYTGDREDALRASDHAKILRRVTGKESYAIVAAVRMGPNIESDIFYDVANFVAANDEQAILWYQLDEERLEPLDPC